MTPTEQFNSLTEACAEIIPPLLSDKPVSGTAIAKAVMTRCGCRWTESSVRFRLSILAQDPNSYIKKYVDKMGVVRQGFVHREESERSWAPAHQRDVAVVLERAADLSAALEGNSESTPAFWGRINRAHELYKEANEQIKN